MDKYEYIGDTKHLIISSEIKRGGKNKKINLLVLDIFGEIEGHDCLGNNTKKTSYDEVLPLLAYVQAQPDIHGVLMLVNTVGGDVEAGLAIAEMVASLDKPTVSLVLGGGHSIGMPLSASCDVTYIAPTATMVVHPIRMSGMVLGVTQNYEYIERMQDRIIDFTVNHSNIDEDKLRSIMFNTKELTKDIGSVLIGEQAVKAGIIEKTGGIQEAFASLYDLIYRQNDSKI